MDWIRQLLIDFFVPIAWPLTTLVVVFVFRKPIHDFARRLVRISPTGVEAIPPRQTTERLATEKDGGESVEPLLPLAPDPSIVFWEDQINKMIATANINDTDDLRNRLIRALAHQTRRGDFEYLSRLIFGTQIALLRHLEHSEPQTKDSLSDLYDEHEIRTLEFGETTFEKWISFLLQHNLVEFNEGRYAITDIGRQFLDFATRSGLSENTGL